MNTNQELIKWLKREAKKALKKSKRNYAESEGVNDEKIYQAFVDEGRAQAFKEALHCLKNPKVESV